jgi:predicted metal-dependent phosphotriesterase family hydrolase
MANPLPTESFRKIVSGLLDRGMPERDVRRMVADNPRQLLGTA